MMIRFCLAAALMLTLLAALACSADDPVSREEVLVSLTDDVIAPRFQTLAERTDTLRSSLRSLCEQPTRARLDAARTAWRDARAPWLRSQAAWFGPIMDRRSRSLVDWSPVEPQRIEDMLAKRDSIDANYAREFLSSTQRGLGAIEYVLFQDDAAVLAALGEPGSIRCQYVVALGDVAADETGAAFDDWTGDNPEGRAYAGYLNGTAASSLIGRAAVDEVVSGSIHLSRIISDMGLGRALGVEDTQPDPSAIPGGVGHNQVADIRNQTLGMQDIYVGASDPDRGDLGIGALVRGVDEDADQRVRAAFTAALAAIDGLSEPLPETMRQNPGPALAAYQSLKELQITLNTDVVSVLGVTVGFADTDGDGG